MNYLKKLSIVGVGFAVYLGTGPVAAQGQEQTNIVPRADAVLRGACQYLAEVPQFTAKAELWWERVTESGEKLQFTRLMELHVKRPDRLHAEIRAPLSDRGFWYDGKALTILDRKRNLYSTAPMPGTLDAALDAAHDQLRMDLPLIDLALSDPYKNAVARVEHGRYFGLASVLGVECHHLAFTQDNIDWQLWVQDGPRPFIRKLVITHKNEQGSPEFTALLTEWNLTDPIAAMDFVFQPPVGASHVEMGKEDVSSSGGDSPAGGRSADNH